MGAVTQRAKCNTQQRAACKKESTKATTSTRATTPHGSMTGKLQAAHKRKGIQCHTHRRSQTPGNEGATQTSNTKSKATATTTSTTGRPQGPARTPHVPAPTPPPASLGPLWRRAHPRQVGPRGTNTAPTARASTTTSPDTGRHPSAEHLAHAETESCAPTCDPADKNAGTPTRPPRTRPQQPEANVLLLAAARRPRPSINNHQPTSRQPRPQHQSRQQDVANLCMRHRCCQHHQYCTQCTVACGFVAFEMHLCRVLGPPLMQLDMKLSHVYGTSRHAAGGNTI
jgi:hypothetical protein